MRVKLPLVVQPIGTKKKTAIDSDSRSSSSQDSDGDGDNSKSESQNSGDVEVTHPSQADVPKKRKRNPGTEVEHEDDDEEELEEPEPEEHDKDKDVQKGAHDDSSDSEAEDKFEDESPYSKDEAAKLAGFRSRQPRSFEAALLKGTTFNTWDDFHAAVREYEGSSRYRFQYPKTDGVQARRICRGWSTTRGKNGEEHCRVELTARLRAKSGKVTIQKIFLIHTCKTSIHKFCSGAHRAEWVADRIAANVAINPGMTIKQVVNHMREFHGASVPDSVAQRARVLCKERRTGGTAQTYEKIPAYVQYLKVIDPEGHAAFDSDPVDNHRFISLYVAPASSIQVARHSRRMVGFDGTFCHQKWKQTMLLAACFDTENEICILAWGVVKKENFQNWKSFLTNFRSSYPMFARDDVVLMSDRDKGLDKAAETVFPLAPHANCTHHLKMNVRKNCDDAAKDYFPKLVQAKTEREYDDILNAFEPSIQQKEAWLRYMKTIKPETFARYAFPGRRYGQYTSNVVEILNKALKPARQLPALLLSDFVWVHVMTHHAKRAEHAKDLGTSPLALTDWANDRLQGLFSDSGSVEELRSSDTDSLMVDSKGSWVLRVNEQYCDCLDWQEFDFPCVHAVRWMTAHGKEPKEYVGSIWRASEYRAAYSVPVPPLAMERIPPPLEPCCAPHPKPPKKGRTVKKRKPSRGEHRQREDGTNSRKQDQRCSECHQPGHNARKHKRERAEQERRERERAKTLQPSSSASHRQVISSSHDTLRLGSVAAAQRIYMEQDWSTFQTREYANSSYDEAAYHSVDILSGTGSSQVTQDR